MKTTFNGILASELLAVCSETTERQRVKKKEEQVRKFSDEEVEKIFDTMPGWGETVKTQLMSTLALLLKAPELALAGNQKRMFALYSVVVCEKNLSSHPWKKEPFIVVHSKNQCGLGPDGNINAFYRDNDKPRLATAAEIVKCIENLTELQWTKVRTDPLFSPIVATAMNRGVEIDENEVILSEADKQAAEETP